MMNLAQLLAGIRQVESGGNYSVVNGIGAVGAYQVMKANIPDWTRRALGYAMTWQQFRDSRAAQDKVAQVILGGYFSKYGAEGAASMWFSGQSNPNSRASDGGNTVRQYVDKVMAAAGGADAPGGGTSTVTSTGAGTPKLSADELASSYGLTSALINSSRELKKLFSQAVSGQWTGDLFQAKLKNTDWWKTQSDSLRQFITQKYTDPATYQQKWGAAQASVNALAVQVGLGNQIDSHGHSSLTLRAAIYNSLALGWTDARIKDWLGSKIAGGGDLMSGEAGDAFDKLHQVAYLNGMKYGGWYSDAARAVVSGRMTMEDAEATIRKQAAAKYSAFADQIKAGQNVMDLASPYIKSTAQILELPDTDVDLFNPHVSKAMTANAGGQPYSLWQYETDLRSDPMWRKTKNAQDGLMGTAHQVLQQMGMMF